MTTFHDPPPHSRRATRQSERERASDDQPAVEGFTNFPSQQANENRVYETPVNPNTQTPPPATPAAPAVPPTPAASRPSADAAYRAAPPPLPQTQNSALAPPPPPSAPVAPPAANESNAPKYIPTRRELREIRARQEAEFEAAAAAVAPVAPPVPEAPVAPPSLLPNANADAVPHYPYSGSAGQPSAPRSPQPPTVEPKVPAYIEPPALVDPLAVVPEAASAGAPPENALSVFESLLANADGSANDPAANDSPRSPLADPPRDTRPAKSASELKFGGASTPPAPQQTSAHPPAAQQPNQVPEQNSDSHSVLAGLLGFGADTPTEPAANKPAAPATNLSNARAEFEAQARKRLDRELPPAGSTPVPPRVMPSPAPTIDASAAKPAPTGHWSRQAAAKDEPNDSVVARTISSGSSATSALVLPAIPFATDIRGPLNSNGETMLTGSIDLPNTLSASGVSDRFDRADIDSLLDLNDSDMVSTDSAPVRAVKAVSTFSNQSVTQTQKPKGTRTLTALLIAACSMAVVVAGLLVAAFAFNML